jgi:hypothetical protein
VRFGGQSRLRLIAGIGCSAGDRRAHHKAAGEITLQQMLHEWAMHDLGHIRQIAELVRARKHWQLEAVAQACGAVEWWVSLPVSVPVSGFESEALPRQPE